MHNQLYPTVILNRMEAMLATIKNPQFREFLSAALEKAHAGDFTDLRLASNYRFYPVGVEEFVESPMYLNAKGNVWPKVMEALIELNSGQYVEAVLTGGIGVAKTTVALYTTAYQLYLLSALRNPHALYGLDPSSEIEFIFQSINEKLAKAVDYARFRSLLDRSEYFRTQFKMDARITSECRFPHNILVKPVGGSGAAAIGQNVMGGLIDEMNFMAVIDKSKLSDGGTYNQATEVYDTLSRRRKSRFMQKGKMPGILCLVSSKKFPGQFTDLKTAEAMKEIQETGSTSIYIYDKKAWEVKPEGTFSPERFHMFTGSESRKPAIIKPEERHLYSDSEIVDVPLEYLSEFERDPMGSLRDIAGVSTLARFPYILDPAKVSDAMGKHHSVFGSEWTDFVSQPLQLFTKRVIKPEIPRFLHVDLAVTGDSAGVCLGTIVGFTKVKLGDYSETLPKVHIDGMLEVKPPKNGEILFHKIRSVIYALKDAGINIRWVTFDTYQSKDSMQILKQKGFLVGNISTDTSMLPYDVTKTALYDGRIAMPEHAKLRSELVSLERDVKKGKIDHPSTGSKDVADAFASVVYGISYRREMWARYGVSPTSAIDALAAKHDEHINKMSK